MDPLEDLADGWQVWNAETGGRVVLAYRPDVSDGDAFPAACLPTPTVAPGESPDPPRGPGRWYAARHPDRVAGLVLADTFAPKRLSLGERLQRSVLLRATVPPVRLLGYERVERAMVWLQEKISGEGVSGDYEQIERIRASGPKMATDEFAKVIGAVAGFHHTEVRFPAITASTLVLYGEHEAPSNVRDTVPQEIDAVIEGKTIIDDVTWQTRGGVVAGGGQGDGGIGREAQRAGA
jgi:hypothetical protein